MKSVLKEKIFEKIKQEHVNPIPESHFINRKRVIWVGIFMTFLLAALLGWFLLTDSTEFFLVGWMRGKNAWVFGFPVFLWISGITLAILVGIWIFRKTPVGYRYSLWKDLIVIFLLLLAWVLFLRWSGFWPWVHGFFVENVPMVSNLVYRESLWNDAMEGKLAGKVWEIRAGSFLLEAIDGKVWTITTEESHVSPKVLIQKGEKIRIIGKMTWEESFASQKILPWFGQWFQKGGNGEGRWNGRERGRGE